MIREDWTKVLSRGDEALRERLARQPVSRESEAVTEPPPVPPSLAPADSATMLQAAAAEPSAAAEAIVETLPALPPAVDEPPPVAATAVQVESTSVPDPQAAPLPVVAVSPDVPVGEPLPHLFAQLSTGDRIAAPVLYRDSTFLIALGIVAFLLLWAAVTTLQFGDELPEQSAEQEKRGQVEKSESITVELVEEPDARSKSKVSQSGENAPVAPPTPPTPDEPNQPTPPEPEEKLAEPEKKPQPQKAEKPAQKPLSVDDFDVTMNDYAKALDHAQEQRRKQKVQQQTAQNSRIAGAAPQGQQSPYVKSVLAVVAAHKPKLYLSKGEVYVQFILNTSGQIATIKVVESSGDKLLDQIALDSLKVLKFPVPPPNVPPNDLNYVIHYVMH